MAGDPEKCSWYNEKKRRFCGFAAKAGTKFCGNHLPGARRVPCPINPNHDVLESEVEAHVRKCPDRLKKEKEEVTTHIKRQSYDLFAYI